METAPSSRRRYRLRGCWQGRGRRSGRGGPSSRETRVVPAAGDGAGVDVSAAIGAGRMSTDGFLAGRSGGNAAKILPRARRRSRRRPRRARGGNAITKTVRDGRPRPVRLADAPADARPSGDGRRPDAHIATVLGATVKTV